MMGWRRVAMVAASWACFSVVFAALYSSTGAVLAALVMFVVILIGATVGWMSGLMRDLAASRARATESEKRWEAASRQARALFDASLDPLAAVKADGTITDANRAMATATGLERADLVGRDIATFFADQVMVRGAIKDAVERGALRDLLVTMSSAQGDREVLVNATLMQPMPDDERSVLFAARDVTERLREAREAISQRDAMARNERLSQLGTLVAGVAHEINNPLTYLAGNIELALLDVEEARLALEGKAETGPDLGETTRELKTALAGAERLAQLTRALKAVSRQNAVVKREPLRLNDVVANVRALLRVATPDSVGLHFVPDAGEPIVLADASELHQVLLNLVRNSIDALEENGGGHVWVTTRAGAAGAELEVRDDGPGIPLDMQARIFTPFFTTKPHGTGLGLSIVHGIVTDQGGDIVVRSEPGRGATFTVRFPNAAPIAPEGPSS